MDIDRDNQFVFEGFLPDYDELLQEFLANYNGEYSWGLQAESDGWYGYEIEPYGYDECINAADAYKISKSEDPWGEFNSIIDEAWYDEIAHVEDTIFNEFNDWLIDQDIEPCDDIGTFQDRVEIYVNTDHYLDYEYPCRLLIDTGDANWDFSLNPSYYNDWLGRGEDSQDEIGEPASLVWIAKTQGYSLEELRNALKTDDRNSLDTFLKSMRQEAENAQGGCFAFLVTSTLREIIQIAAGDYSSIFVPADVMCGIFEPFTGGGSVLDVQLNTGITIPKNYVWEFAPDEYKAGYRSIMDVYGMLSSAYNTEIEIN